jgi:hypothetical protein
MSTTWQQIAYSFYLEHECIPLLPKDTAAFLLHASAAGPVRGISAA